MILQNNIFSTITSIIFIMTILFSSCNSAEQNKMIKTTDTIQNEITVPQLLPRSERIQLGKEWENVRKFYAVQKASIRKNPNDYEAHLNLIELYVKEARVTGEHGHYYPAALQLANRILGADSLKKDIIFRTLMTKAGVQLSLHEFSDALETGLTALKINSNNAQVYGVLVDAYLEMGNYDEAVKMADKMINIKPDLRSYSRISYLREVFGDIDGAIDAMELAIGAGFPGTEETAWAMLTLGDLHKNYKDSKTAEKIYTQILEVRKDYPFALGALAEIYFSEKDYEKTETTLEEGISIIPEVGFYIQLAELYKTQGRTEEFENLIPEILAMLKDDVDNGHIMNLEYAHLYMDLIEDNDKAFEYAKIEYDKRPNNIDTNLAMAEALHARKVNNAEVVKYLEVAKKTNSINPDLIALVDQYEL